MKKVHSYSKFNGFNFAKQIGPKNSTSGETKKAKLSIKPKTTSTAKQATKTTSAAKQATKTPEHDWKTTTKKPQDNKWTYVQWYLWLFWATLERSGIDASPEFLNEAKTAAIGYIMRTKNTRDQKRHNITVVGKFIKIRRNGKWTISFRLGLWDSKTNKVSKDVLSKEDINDLKIFCKGIDDFLSKWVKTYYKTKKSPTNIPWDIEGKSSTGSDWNSIHPNEEWIVDFNSLEQELKQKQEQEERRTEQQRRAATIIQITWRRLVDARAEEARILKIESDKRMRKTFVTVGSYFIGAASILLTSFF